MRPSRNAFSRGSRSLAIVAGMMALCLVGYVCAQRPILGVLIAVAVGAVLVAAVPLRSHGGLLVGVLVIAYCNGIPFVDMHEVKFGGVSARDMVFLAVVLSGAFFWARSRASAGRMTVMLSRAMVAFVLVWLLSVLQAAFTIGTFSGAILLGRDMLVFVLALPIAIVCMEQKQAQAFRLVIIIGGVLSSIGVCLSALAGIDSGLLHATATNSFAGTTRAYMQMEYLSNAALVLAVGSWLFERDRRRQAVYMVGMVILTMGFMFMFVRASYIGLAAGLVVGAIVLLVGTRWKASRERLALLGLGIAAAVTGSTLIGGRPTESVFAPFIQRLATVSVDLSTGGGTFGERVSLYNDMIDVLGRSWLTGLGFVHPRDHVFSSLPAGTIRNVDTGMLGVLMTQGILGVLVIGLVLWVAIKAARCLLRHDQPLVQATGWSLVVYVTLSVVTSFSLMYLAGAQGLAATAAMVGITVGLADGVHPGPRTG